ncbi:hypothetical protein B0T22DRAFT_537156 [Podospora appendiculata]|uniref:Uncharacterized protein n=1 Tax=Podospora appendiculata TaxID=314037 RepID=A0AAE0XDY3_9PEZI|nr:hypothetical protein B0T22DRAFT_537156 [Podospora appendiculata]
MPGINALPAEMLLKIVGSTVTATPRWPADRLESQSVQYNLCLVSRRFRELATPLLYRHVVLSRYLDRQKNEAIATRLGVYDPEHDFSTDRLVLFLRTLLASPRHRELVWNLDLRIYLTQLVGESGQLEMWRSKEDILDADVSSPQALINDYKGILRSWASHALKMFSYFPSCDKRAKAIIAHVGLDLTLSSPEASTDNDQILSYLQPTGDGKKAKDFLRRAYGASLVGRLSEHEQQLQRLRMLALPKDIGQRIFAAILCLASNLRTLTIRSPPSCNTVNIDPATAFRQSYASTSFLVSSALTDPLLGPTVLPRLETYRVALGMGEVFRRDPLLGLAFTGNPFEPYFRVLPHVRPGILEAPNCATNITRFAFIDILAEDIQEIVPRVCKAWRLKELVYDVPPPYFPPQVDPRVLDDGLLPVKDTLEILELVVDMQYNHRGDYTLRKHLHDSEVTLFGRHRHRSPAPLLPAGVLPPGLVSLRLAERPFVKSHEHQWMKRSLLAPVCRKSAWGFADITETMPRGVEMLAMFAGVCAITHPELRMLVYEDSGLVEPGMYGSSEESRVYKEEWFLVLRALFARAGVRFSWVPTNGVAFLCNFAHE